MTMPGRVGATAGRARYPARTSLVPGTIRSSMAATLQRLDLRGVTGELKSHLPRPALDGEGPVAAVRDILAQVKEGGDDAVRALTASFDGVVIDDLRVPQSSLDAALAGIPRELRDGLETARAAIES